jgi:hypothetical protein
MAYIGKQPTVGNFVKLDTITTSATATYNLTNGGVAYSPQSANHCIVSLNGVIQSPTTSFTISGSTIVFASALTSSDVIDFILVLGDVLNIGTPSDATVGFSKVTSNLITGATSESTIAGGDSILIYDDSASALRKMTRTNFIGGGNTPAWFASISTDQTISNGVNTLVALDNVVIDTDSAFDNTATNYKFTVPSGKGGKYLVSFGMRNDAETAPRIDYSLFINGVEAHNTENGSGSDYDTSTNTKLLNLTAGDYLQCKIYQSSGGNMNLFSSRTSTFMCGFKLI